MISNVPKDHHSLLQLYLDGPKDKIFYVFSLHEDLKQKINIKNKTIFKNYLHQKKLTTIKNAQKKALIKVLKIRKIDDNLIEFDINLVSSPLASNVVGILEVIR